MLKSIHETAMLFKTFDSNISKMSRLPLELMVYGTMAVTICIIAFTAFIVYSGIPVLSVPGMGYFRLSELAEAFYPGALFALCVIWGGSFFLDYAAKH